jgi:hypothetical protein
MALELTPDERRVTLEALAQYVDGADDTSKAMADDNSLEDDDWCEVEEDFSSDVTFAVQAMAKIKEEVEGDDHRK